MNVIDLTPENHDIYFQCLEDWSDEIKEAGDHKACWYDTYKDKALRVKLAVDDNGIVGGMIQYLPVEESFVDGKDLYFILCVWVHGRKQGRGNFQKKAWEEHCLRLRRRTPNHGAQRAWQPGAYGRPSG